MLVLVITQIVGTVGVGVAPATDLAEPHHKARPLALVVWVGTLGSVLGPNLGVPGEILNRAIGLTVYDGAFLIAAIWLALAGPIIFLLLRLDPLLVLGQPAPTSQATPSGAQRGRIRAVHAELRANRRARFAVIAILTAQVVIVSIMTMTPAHLATRAAR
ncbi:hypothetical protein [Georgenia subflava]|uniref:MFS transporter n=1 Tax=Georgenia subflava TaxID=1622177 RepID=A0A6N7ELT6_9MICO|nr:hypothetical protein [Georgenia subflava]MPV38033.1 hypothetical protein [Georgenia subflava]